MSNLANVLGPNNNLNFPDNEASELPPQNNNRGDFDDAMSQALSKPVSPQNPAPSSRYAPLSPVKQPVPPKSNEAVTDDNTGSAPALSQSTALSPSNSDAIVAVSNRRKNESEKTDAAKKAQADSAQTTTNTDDSPPITNPFLAPTVTAFLFNTGFLAGTSTLGGNGTGASASLMANGSVDVIQADNGKKGQPASAVKSFAAAKTNASAAPTATDKNMGGSVKGTALTGDPVATASVHGPGDADKIAGAKLTTVKNDLSSSVTEKAINAGNSAKNAIQTALLSAGTAVANDPLTMKKAENTNNDAGQAEKVLPGDNFSIARMSNSLPAISAATSLHDTPTASNIISLSSALDRTTATNVSDAVAVANLSDMRDRAMERTHDMVTMNALRLVSTQSDSLQVVLKPGAGTQLSLELRQRGDVIEAQAVLQHGDFQNLSQHWPDLQQRLEQKGIKLGDLTSDESSLTFNDNQGNSKNSSPEQDALFASAFAEFSLAGAAHAATAAPIVAISGGNGWETWA